MSCPVIAAASSESKKAISAAISAGRMRRPIGGTFGATLCRAASPVIAVCVAAGDTTFTVTPLATASAAQLRASETSAALVAPYWLRPGTPCAIDRRRCHVEPDHLPTVVEQAAGNGPSDPRAGAGDQHSSRASVRHRLLGSDMRFVDELSRIRHVLALEAREIVDRARRKQQPLRLELLAQVASVLFDSAFSRCVTSDGSFAGPHNPYQL